MDCVWAPWRGDYVTNDVRKASGSGCVFCNLQTHPVERDVFILQRTERVFVVMNRFPYNNGHLLVLPTAHLAEFDTLDEPTFLELNATVRQMLILIRQVLHPEGFNVGLNLGKNAGAGIPDHLHYHIVPRWHGDTNFMPVVAETKVISQHILHTYDLLKAQL